MQSMTGFGAAEGERAAARWRWDLRSVNGKGLDVRLRTPGGWERCEAEWRALAAARFKRGSISMALSVSETTERAPLLLNAAALQAALEAAAEARRMTEAMGLEAAAVQIDGLLGLRGVLGSEPVDAAGLAETAADAVTASLAAALDALETARTEEGAKTRDALTELLSRIETLTVQAEAQAATRGPEQKARLAAKVAALLEAGAELPEARLAQELALLAVKADVAEEIERLKIHIGSARDLIASDGPIGRKLDFLTQEFNREANTLCSKSQDAALTDLGVELKVSIDQLREQAANIA